MERLHLRRRAHGSRIGITLITLACHRLQDDFLQPRIDRAAYRPGSGAEQLANYFVGQIVGSMNVAKPAAQVVFDMIDEFIESVQALAKQLDA